MALPRNPGGREFGPGGEDQEKKVTEELQKQKALRDQLLRMTAQERRDSGASKELLESINAELSRQNELEKAGNALRDLGVKKIDQAAAAQTAAYMVSKNQTASIRGMASEYQRLEGIIKSAAAAEEASKSLPKGERKPAREAAKAAGEEALKQQQNLKARFDRELRLGGTSMGRAELARTAGSSELGASKAVNTGSVLGGLLGRSKLITDLGEAQVDAAAGGKALGAGQLAASAGIEGLVSAMGAIAPALTTAASGVALFGSVFKFVLQTLDEGRMIGGKSMQALALNSKDAFNEMSLTGGGAAEAIRAASGLTITDIGMMGGAFQNDLIPAAQAAMMTFNTWDRAADNVNKFTGTLIKGAVEGAAAGIPFAESMAMMAKATRSFGVSDAGALRTFRTMKNGARESHLAINDFNEVLGDSVEWGKRFGDQSGMYAQMATILSPGKLGTAQRMMVGQGVAGLAMSPFRMLGLSAGASGSSAAAMAGVWKASAEGGAGKKGILGFAQETLAKTMEVKRFGGGQHDVWQALKEGDIQEKTQAAMFAAAQLTGKTENFTAFAKPGFADDVQKMLKGDKDAAAKVKANLEDSDAQTKGIRSIVQNTDGLKIIQEAVLSMAKTLVHMSTSVVLKATVGTAESRAEEAKIKAMESKALTTGKQ